MLFSGFFPNEIPKGIKHLSSVSLCFCFRPDEPNQAVLIKDNAAPNDALVLFPVHLFLSPGAKGLQRPVFRITEKLQREVEFVLEFFMRRH